MTSLCVPGDSEGDEEETTQDEVSSHTSEEDGGVVKVEKELENAEAPVGSGDALVEHEASDRQSSARQLSLPSQPAPPKLSHSELLSQEVSRFNQSGYLVEPASKYIDCILRIHARNM